MSQLSNLPQSPGPLSVGNVVSAALRIYRDRFKAYLGVSVRVSLWLVCPFLALFLCVILAIPIFSNNQINPAFFLLFFLLFLVWLFFAIYCFTKSLRNAALISRLSFGILNNRPETVGEATRNMSGLWIFFWLQFVVGIILNFVNLLLSSARYFIFDLPAGNINQPPITSLMFLVGISLYYAIYFWFLARFFLPEVPLAVEENIGIDAISRSWELTKGFAWKIALIITVAMLITIPVYLLAAIPVFIAIASLIPQLAISPESPPSLEATIGLGSAFLISILIFLSLNVVALPFWQTVKGVIYYDLRSRKEGLGLELRDSR